MIRRVYRQLPPPDLAVFPIFPPLRHVARQAWQGFSMSSPGVEPGPRPSRGRVRCSVTLRGRVKRQVIIQHLSFAIRNLQFAVRHLQFAIRHLQFAVRHPPSGISNPLPNHCPCQESNLVCDLRRVACESVTLQGRESSRRVPDRARTGILRLTSGHAACCATDTAEGKGFEPSRHDGRTP